MLGSQWGALEDYCSITDTLVMAREMHPGQKNSLDALCQRYEIDNSQRNLHGALLDAQILLDVYLAMTGGQTELLLDENVSSQHQHVTRSVQLDPDREKLKIIQPTDEELLAHQRKIEVIEDLSDGHCLWKSLEN